MKLEPVPFRDATPPAAFPAILAIPQHVALCHLALDVFSLEGNCPGPSFDSAPSPWSPSGT